MHSHDESEANIRRNGGGGSGGGRGRGFGVGCYSSYPDSAPLSMLSKASFTRREAGRELGREPPPGEDGLGARRVDVPVLGLFKRTVSSEWAGEGLGVRILKERKQENKYEMKKKKTMKKR